MSRFAPQLPSGETTTDAFARELVSLLGYQAPDGSLLAADARVLGAALAAAYDRLADAAGEAFTTTLDELLSEWEQRLGLPVSPQYTPARRRELATAARRSTGGNTLGVMLAALRAVDATATLIRSPAAANTTYPRGVFRFTVRLAAAVYDDPALYARMVSLVERMRPAHYGYEIARGDWFLTDDPESLTDTVGDVLGS